MSPEGDSEPLSGALPDFHKLFRDLDSTVATSVRSATCEGVRLGIGFAISCTDVAHETAAAHGASQDTLAWLRLLAASLRKATVSDELARLLDEDR